VREKSVDPVNVGLLGIALLLVLIFSRMAVGAALALVGFLGFAYLSGVGPALSGLFLISFSSIVRYDFAVIPLFLLMGEMVGQAGIGKEAYESARTWVGEIRGGIAMATIVACGLFAAVCGSSLATAIALGKVAHPEMKRMRYDPALSIGCIAAGGTLGILIPPSIAFVLIGILTEVSIAKLFIAGIIPGITVVVFYIVTIYILCKFRPELGPAIARTSISQKLVSLKGTWAVATLFLLVIVGIYGGIFTPSEAGGIGAFGAIVIGLARRQLSRRAFGNGLVEAGRQSAMIIAMVLGAFIFMRFLAITQIPEKATEFVIGLNAPGWCILAVIIAGFILLGMFFDMYAVVIITTPILFPVIIGMGYDPLWYGVIMVRMIEIGMISPPFGINLFGVAATLEEPLEQVYKGSIPFVISDIANVALLIAVPQLSTFLPKLMG
jgi:C4-dicarboxylate transporter, DctM subunit